MLGKLRDEEVAAQTGHPVGSVLAKRCLLGIPLSNPKKRSWTPEEDAILGTDTDKVIGEQIGRDKVDVHKRRHLLGIPAWGRRRRG
jgi:hypothetical protein